jgi:hypothetical protein
MEGKIGKFAGMIAQRQVRLARSSCMTPPKSPLARSYPTAQHTNPKPNARWRESFSFEPSIPAGCTGA